MTDRFHSLIVHLEKEIREDDAEHLISAIEQLRGVIGVQGNVAGIEFYSAKEQARHDLKMEILQILKPDWMKNKS